MEYENINSGENVSFQIARDALSVVGFIVLMFVSGWKVSLDQTGLIRFEVKVETKAHAGLFCPTTQNSARFALFPWQSEQWKLLRLTFTEWIQGLL